MSTVLVIISKDIIRRNILETDFWQTLRSENPGWRIVLIVDEDQQEMYQQYTADDVIVAGYRRIRSRPPIARLINFLIRTGVNSHSTRTYRNRAYQRGESTLSAYLVKVAIANTLGRSSLFKTLMRWAFLKTTMPKQARELFDQYKPKIVFAPSLIDNEFDAVFGAVAKQRGIRLVGMVRSWDNLNNHGILSIRPDRFIFQNEFLIEAASRFQGLSAARDETEPIGLPHYDQYVDPSQFVKSREAFCEAIGADPSKRLILLGGSDFYYSEDVLPKTLNDMIETGAIPSDVQIIFRPHPSSIFSIEEYGLDALEHVILNDAFRGEVKFNDTEQFVNLIYHSDIVINICSTLSIDAAVFRTPAICINFDDPNRTLSYYEEVGRLYDHFDHYEALIATDGVYLPRSSEELARDINTALSNPNARSKQQQRIIDRFVAPFDGQAGARLGSLVATELVAAKQ